MTAPVIAETLLTHSNIRVRNVDDWRQSAHADPHMDLPPEDRSTRRCGYRSASARWSRSKTSYGYLETVRNNELITAVSIPPQIGRRYVCQMHRPAAVTGRSASPYRSGRGRDRTRRPHRDRRRYRNGAAAAASEAALAGRRQRRNIAPRRCGCRGPVVADHHGSAAFKRVLIEVHLQRALRRALDGAPR
jgi:CO/xanthine dehydrogenase FAD-binding subunit